MPSWSHAGRRRSRNWRGTVLPSNPVAARRPDRHALAHALAISGIYLVVGVAWILGSDYLAELLADKLGGFATIQRYKGIVYVLVTAAGLFGLILNALARVQAVQGRLTESARRTHELGVRLNAIIDAAPVAIFDLSHDLVVGNLWNPAAERLFGYTTEEAVGTRPDVISERAWEQIGESRRAVESGDSVALVEVTLSRRDGTEFQAAVSAAPVELGQERSTIVLVSDITRLTEAVARLQESLAEREVLLREIHHRVRNSLQVVSSLLMLERSSSEDPERGIARALARIRSIARVHEMLYYRPNLARIDLAGYLRTLGTDIVTGLDPSKRVELLLELDPVEVDVDIAVPIGLIFHELLASACRRAVSGGTPAAVTATLLRNERTIIVGVEGTGAGTDVEPAETADAAEGGLMLVRTLAAQVNATIDAGRDRVTTVRIALDEPEAEGRAWPDGAD